jgi:hypothetical protein
MKTYWLIRVKVIDVFSADNHFYIDTNGSFTRQAFPIESYAGAAKIYNAIDLANNDLIVQKELLEISEEIVDSHGTV